MPALRLSGARRDMPAGRLCGQVLAVEGRAVPSAVTYIFFTVVMISVKHIEPFPAVKFPEQAEYVIVDIYDPREGMIFPQFIAVSEFQVSISLLKIMLECSKI